ncbi:MAG: hemin uptake protein HemP [Pirellulaceae bacterium]
MNRLPVDLAADETAHDKSLPREEACPNQAVPQTPISSELGRLEQTQNTSPAQQCSLRSANEPGESEGEVFCLCRDRAHVRVVRSEDLLHGHRELMIVHGQEVYRLFCTRNNKLILQK